MICLLLLPMLATTLRFAPHFKDCNASQLDFFSHYSLGQQKELNHTFALLQKRLAPLPNVTFNSSSLLFRYTLAQTTAEYYYRDSQQKAEIIGQNIIYVKGGRTQTNLSFVYYKNSQKGTGSASCLTDPISFAKLLRMQQGFIIFKVGDYTNVSYYSQPCNITRVDPPLQSKDIQILQTMINDNQNHNIKNYLEAQIARNYVNALNQSLKEERMHIDTEYNYTWATPGNNNFTINYTLVPVGGHLQNIGLFLNYVTQITQDQHWKCGSTIPASPKDPKLFGGIQEYLSLSVFENSIRYAVEQGHMDTDLNQDKWQSRMFQFYAGDLYQIIPAIRSKFYANQPVTGTCNASTTNLKLVQSQNNTLLVSLHYSCLLLIANTVVSQFEVDPNFIVQIRPNHQQLNFHVVDLNQFAHFRDVGQFVVENKELANLFLTFSLDRLLEGKVFGSGWKIYPRDYPAALLEDGVLFIYDKAN